MKVYISDIKALSFIAGTLTLIRDHSWNEGEDLRVLLKRKRKELHQANAAFNDTWNKPCGYQDRAADLCEQVGSEYMQMVHAYLTCRYGYLTKRFTDIMSSTFGKEVA
jgi:hypothetical protein